MKTLILTSIYNNLWGTKFGGRPSREAHYRLSLLNILNLKADKFICFTSQEELEKLETFFHEENNISKDVLEIRVFDLENSKYYNKIDSIKDHEWIKTIDRCHEIQYNKFFWLETIENILDYQKVYWFDAGLSHGGLFPEEYSFGDSYTKHYNFNLFNKKYLEHIHKLTDDGKFLIVSKNNTGRFYWSQTIPQKYYREYDNTKHIIGGFFGGNLDSFIKVKNKFDELLTSLLDNEKELYYEELIMSCLYRNNLDDFITLDFDDWYDRNNSSNLGDKTSFFYNIFEIEKKQKTCICTISIELNEISTRYTDNAKKLIESYLKFTDFDILLITNKVDRFEEFTSDRLKIFDYENNFDETITSANKFNMHLKRYPIKLASYMKYDFVYFHDCDCFIDGWDRLSYEKKCKEDFDVAFVSHANPQLGGLRKTYKHFQDKIDSEFVGIYTDEMDSAPNPAETRVLFRKNEKLQDFISFWDKISSQNKNFFTYHDGVYFGTSAIFAKMKMIGITPSEKFTKYCKINHEERVLDYFGTTVTREEVVEPKQIEISNVNNGDEVYGSFVYKDFYVLQMKNVKDNLKKLFEKVQPKRVVEIGTEYGGLTIIISDIFSELNLTDSKVRTYDIKDCPGLKTHVNLPDNIEFVCENIFENDRFKLVEKSKESLNEFLVDDGVNIFMCDGSNQIKEFKSLAPLCKKGDIIMVHDYVEDSETFRNEFENKKWNWHEIRLKDIRDIIDYLDFEKFDYENMCDVVWGCFIKK